MCGMDASMKAWVLHFRRKEVERHGCKHDGLGASLQTWKVEGQVCKHESLGASLQKEGSGASCGAQFSLCDKGWTRDAGTTTQFDL
jgi:hypothetical protein